MERRSTRGRTSSISEPSTSPTKQVTISLPPPAMEEVAPDVPDIGGEEVVLNRRGMPARQRKRNRFYYDDEVMVTPETPGRKSGGSSSTGSRSPGKKQIKIEPIDEDEAETITADIPDYEFGTEVEIQTEPTPPPLPPPQPKGRGRPSTKNRSSSPIPTPRSYHRKSAAEKAAKSGASYDPPRGTAKSSRSQQAEPSPKRTPKSKERGESSEPRQSSSKGSNPRRVRPELSAGKLSRRELNEDPKATANKSEAMAALSKVIARIKKEPGAAYMAEKVDQRDKVRQERIKDKASKYDTKYDRRNSEREFGEVSISSSKSRKQSRGLTPPLSDFLGVIPGVGVGQDDMNKQAIDKKTAQDISLRLRNLLKLPKAHKWVCYEWFYSNIDKVLFEGENDFQICLKESFPQLKARKLTRVEWCKIRRLMGKPRRCSQAFFDEEREELGRRRQKIRMIQQRKITDFNYKELPDEIPLQLTIGTKVTARLRRPQDGLFTGTIEGVDTSNNTYRITFDRAGLGTHSIPDYEVLSNDPVETVSTSSFALKIPRRSYGFGTAAFKFQNPGLIGEDGIYRFPTSPFPVDGMLGGFPIRLLDMIVRLSKLLKAKREKILQCKELNVEAEKMRSYGKRLNSDYRLRYARCILDLDSMNKEMAMYVEGIQTYCLEQIAPDHGANQMIVPEQIQEQCRQEANLIVDTYNTKQNRHSVHGTKPLNLIGLLTSLLLQVKTLSNGERNLYELKSVKETIKETKAVLEGKNLQLFQDGVEIPMNRIQAGLCMSNKQY